MTKRTVRIAPSILAADFMHLADQVKECERAGIDVLHCDVMDGHFVPNLTFGPPLIRQLRKLTKLELDVHLMIEQPERSVEAYREAGADVITVHQEVSPHLHRTLQQIRALGARAGVSINPSTPIGMLEPVLGSFDYLLIMTVNPGFGGQRFIESMLSKIVHADRWRAETGFEFTLAVDGGIDPEDDAARGGGGGGSPRGGHGGFRGRDRRERARAARGGGMLKLLTRAVGDYQVNAILAWDEQTKQAVLIDPAADLEAFTAEIEARGLLPVAIVNTHGHLDHICGNADAKRRYPVPLYIHELDRPMLKDPARNMSAFTGEEITSPDADATLKDGDMLAIGAETLKVLHTPGHTTGSICLYQPGLLIAGDTLFCGGVGRTDLPGGSEEEILHSIRSKLYSLPDETAVYSGHGPSTTIGEEKRTNPFVRA